MENIAKLHLTFAKVSRTAAVSSEEIVRDVAYANISQTDQEMLCALPFKIYLLASLPGRSLGTWLGTGGTDPTNSNTLSKS